MSVRIAGWPALWADLTESQVAYRTAVERAAERLAKVRWSATSSASTLGRAPYSADMEAEFRRAVKTLSELALPRAIHLRSLAAGDPTTAAGEDGWLSSSPVVPSLSHARLKAWRDQHLRAVGFTKLPEDWDGEGGLAVDPATVAYAMSQLSNVVGRAPAPSFSPGADGDLWALWAGHGLDIEVCFRRPGDVFAMISDGRGEVVPFEDEDPDLEVTLSALHAMAVRAVDAEQRGHLDRLREELPASTSSVSPELMAA